MTANKCVMKVQSTRREERPICNLEELELDLKLEEDDEDAGAAFITDHWVSERGSPGRCITGAQQEAILK